MMAGEHTPGPWRVVRYGDGDSLVIHDARGDWRVCFMATPGDSGDMAGIEANAALISAAPDLLSVMLDLFENPQFQVGIGGNPNMVEALIDRARAAIAKALNTPKQRSEVE